MNARPKLAVAVVALIAVACGSDAAPTDETTTTSPVPATTAIPEATTTEPPSTTTTTEAVTTTVQMTPLEELGFPVSDEWVVETVIAGIDSATGGLAIDADGNFHQADFGYSGHPGDSVYKISPDGSTIETLIQSDLMDALTMTAVGPDGTMYQSSYGSNRVFKIDSDGTAEVIAEGLRGPTGIVVQEDGTLYVEAYNSGYWNRLQDTREKYRDEWLLTGDLGVEDADGYLWFTSRKDDVISSMGYRIGPGEIEECLIGHPSIAMCAVVGVPDDLRGQVPAAFVVLRDGHDPSDDLAEELQTRVRNRLAAHEVLRIVKFVDDLPRTTTGKIMRRHLRTLL